MAAAIDSEVVLITGLAGGDVAESFRVVGADGDTYFAKTHRKPPPFFFTTEAAGLTWLSDVGAIRVPSVIGASDDPPMLVLEWIDEGSRHGDDSTFGEQLASLHRYGAAAFGRDDCRATTSRALPNDPCEDWPEFFASRRIEPLTRLAADGEVLAPGTVNSLEEVARRIHELVGPAEPPARLHGDLWAGNRLVDTSGRSWIIDPSAFGGHREFDLAMMGLFGGFGDDCFAAYDDAFRLADGWELRVPLYQLAPLITHAIKFGGGYVDATDRAVASVLNG